MLAIAGRCVVRSPGRYPMADELEELYQSTYTAVVRYLYRKVWDADRAEDLAQEVFMRLLAHRPEKPRAWIFAVAANLARDEARAAIRRRRHLVLMQSEPGVQPSRPRAAEDQMEDDEQGAQVKEALCAPSHRATRRYCSSGTPG